MPDPGAGPGSPPGTLVALRDRDPDEPTGAAGTWTGVTTRERVRCLPGAALPGPLPPLLAAEALAGRAGLATLLGRVRRAVRARGMVRRPAARPRSASPLSPREREVLGMVGHGSSTRRVAELLGVARHIAETYVRQGMASVGARTRTEAAVRAAALDDPVPAGS
jgi:DNA-binding CsgD family transcriptional regulator